MAVINGTVVMVSDERYILPTSYIKEIIKNEEKINFSKLGQDSMVKIRDKMFNVIDKKEIFGEKLKNSKDNIVVLFEHEGKQLAMKNRQCNREKRDSCKVKLETLLQR